MAGPSHSDAVDTALTRRGYCGRSVYRSAFARSLRTHKWLRWVHFGGMAVQAVLGVFSANSDLIGLDRANDYTTLQALSTVHLTTGLLTLGALTWAALLML